MVYCECAFVFASCVCQCVGVSLCVCLFARLVDCVCLSSWLIVWEFVCVDCAFVCVWVMLVECLCVLFGWLFGCVAD